MWGPPRKSSEHHFPASFPNLTDQFDWFDLSNLMYFWILCSLSELETEIAAVKKELKETEKVRAPAPKTSYDLPCKQNDERLTYSCITLGTWIERADRSLPTPLRLFLCPALCPAVCHDINPFPRVINFKLPLQPHQSYYITQYEELGF